uniref:N-acetylneuraminate-9-phosphate synthase n=1 Tax=Clastoptera arizonana TaxID=38151 RepID=A0A1B6E5H8_9HEMI
MKKMSAELVITDLKRIGGKNPCFIIAEIGQNHQGNIQIAKKLIQTAKECGADCVKFQKSDLKEKFNHLALARSYLSEHSWGNTYGEHKKYLEFNYQQYGELKEFSEKIGIMFSASAMDQVSLNILNSLNVPFIKIGSGDANNIPLIQLAASTHRPLIISTGMQNIESVRKIYHTVKEVHMNFCILHCVSAYPTPPSEINLRVLTNFQQEFLDIPIGYSGHEIGSAISIAAVAMGAKILERHITLDKSWKGNDHQCSLDPTEFKQLVSDIRLVETAFGNPQKSFQQSEKPCFRKLGKTLVAAMDISEGSVLTADLIKIKVAEPKGIPANYFDLIIGKTIIKSIYKDESILESDIKEDILIKAM